jgi:anthranilate phosphoribosyltransferase
MHEDNARDVRAILAGQPGPRADLALLNAGAAIYAGGRADSIAAGVEHAREAANSGAAQAALEAYIAIGNELAGAA